MAASGKHSFLVIVTISLACATAGVIAATSGGHSSTKANEFHIGFMQNYIESRYRPTLFITTDEPSPVHVTITYRTEEMVYEVEPGVVSKVLLEKKVRVKGPMVRDKGIRIKTDYGRVSVLAMNEVWNSIEGYAALPCTRVPHVSRYEYYAISIPRTTTFENITTADSIFMVVACEDNTTVSMIPTQEIRRPEDYTMSINPGENYTTVLHASHHLYVRSSNDLSGSHVVSDRPITFLSGHECGNIPYNATECNKLVEQLPPTLTWGLEFLTAQTASQRSSHVIKVLAAENDTELTIACASSKGALKRNISIVIATAGETAKFMTSHDEYCHIKADKVVLVVQFMPFMVLVPAVSQYVTDTKFATLEGRRLSFVSYLNVYIPDSRTDYDTVLLDGNPISHEAWVPIPCTTWGTCGYAAEVHVNDSGVHSISHADSNGTLGVTVYGLDHQNTVAYAYVGGLSLSYNKVTIYIVPDNATVETDGTVFATCVAYSGYTPSITWIRDLDQSTLDNSTSSLVTVYEEVVTAEGFIYVQSILKLSSVEVGASGRYSCVASNGFSTDSANFNFTVLPGELLIMEGVEASVSILTGRSYCFSCKFNLMDVDSSQIRWECNQTRHDGSFIVSCGKERLPNGILCITNAGILDSGRYMCSIGVERVAFTLSVVEPPKITDPSPPLHPPGNCRDLTNTTTVTAPVGLNLCVLASPESRVYLECTAENGFPPPTVEWFKDGERINTSNSSALVIHSNGTLELQRILHPIESAATGVPGVTGLYTCSLSNLAGTANASSYIVPFGDISPESVATYNAPIQTALFDQLHHHISSSIVNSDESPVLVAASGRILKYEDYYPGQYFDGGQDTIPSDIMGNMFDLVDVIPNTGSFVTSVDDRNAGSLSMVYEYLIRELQVAPPDTDQETLTEARAYLQEPVRDIGDELNNTIPRLSLYLMYKTRYYQKKLEIEDQIDYQRRRLPGLKFSQWYERNGIVLQNMVSHAYYEWDVYGNKNDTETWLDILNLEDHSAPLNEAIALLLATVRKSKHKDEKVYFPVEFYPSHWFNFLRNKVEESLEQLQYNLAELQAQKKVLEFTKEFLETQLRRRILGVWEQPPVVYSELKAASLALKQEVLFSEEKRYQCLVTRNPIDCQLYSEYDVVVQLMKTFTDLYWEAEFIKTATDHREVSIPLVTAAISSIENEINNLDQLIYFALLDEVDRDIGDEDVVTETEFEGVLTTFSFSTKGIPWNEHDFTVAEQIRNRPLWYLDPRSTFLSSTALLHEYRHTIDHFNSMWTNVTAKYTKVDVHRRWFKPGLFADGHLKLRNESILVSPGLVKPLEDLITLLANSSYELPLYPSSLVLATDIEIFVSVPFPFHTLPILLRLSYDPHIRGGFGPFSFGPLFTGKTGWLKFQVQVRNNGVFILLPGTQLIGYVCNVVPQHPPKTHVPSSRRRRSATIEAKLSEDHGGSEQQSGWNAGVSTWKSGQWLTDGTKYSSPGGEFDELLHSTRRSRGQSTYAQRLHQAAELQKTPLPIQLDSFSFNQSVTFSQRDYHHGYKRRGKRGVHKKPNRFG